VKTLRNSKQQQVINSDRRHITGAIWELVQGSVDGVKGRRQGFISLSSP